MAPSSNRDLQYRPIFASFQPGYSQIAATNSAKEVLLAFDVVYTRLLSVQARGDDDDLQGGEQKVL